MSAVFDLPEDPVTLPDRPCRCGAADFALTQVGPHIKLQCVTCGERQKDFVSRAAVGLGQRSVKREGFDFSVRSEVLQRWKHRCAWCGIPASEALMHVGHIIPRAQVVPLYGEAVADHFLNLAPSCETCNAGAHLTNEYAVNLLLAALRLGIPKS